MSLFKNTSIRIKLILVILFVTILSLAIGLSILGIRNFEKSKQELQLHTELTAKLIGDYASATLLFGSNFNDDAKAILENLRNVPDLVNGRLYNADGELFADYGDTNNSIVLNQKIINGDFSTFENDHLHVIKSIYLDNQKVGYIYLIITADKLYENFQENIYTIFVVFIFSLFIAYLIALQVQKAISLPIMSLTELTNKVSASADYSVRAKIQSNDEIGVLSKAINEMLHQIELRQDEINKSTEALSESEEKYRVLAENMTDVVWTRDLDMNLTYISPSVYNQTGFSINEKLHFQMIDDIITKESAAKVKEIFKEEIINESNLEVDPHRARIVEVDMIKKDGTILPVEMKVSFLRDNNEKAIGIIGINRDISERKISEKALQESELRFREMAQLLPIAIFETDEKLNITYANNQAFKMFGHSESTKLTNLNYTNFINPKDLNRLEENFAKRITRELSKPSIYNISKKDGSELTISLQAIPIFTEDVFSGFRGTILDITEEKKAEEKLRAAKESAEKADKLKSTFLAQMSHEIRTPINAMVSLSSLLKDDLEDQVDEDYKLTFAMIDKAGLRIIRTVDLLLNLSEIQAGSYEIINSSFDLYSDILSKIIKEHKKQARDKNLTISLDIETDDSEIYADSYTVNQIFTQLIDNAIKYTNEGSIKIHLYKNSSEKIIAEIIDTGIGIDKEYLPNIFEPFSQEETGYTRKYEGNGIGLTLVKQYCDMNNATIEVVSEKGKGSTFRVIF